MKKKHLNSESYGVFIASSILFCFLWYISDLRTSFDITLFVVCIITFIYNMIYAYLILIEDKLSLKKNYRWWWYFITSTGMCVVLTLCFLPKLLLILSLTISFSVLSALLVYDLIKRLLRKL